MNVKIETPRLLLQTIDESRASEVADFVVRNRDFLQEWEPARDPEYYTEAFQKRQLQYDQLNMDQGLLLKMWISKKIDPGRLIGSVSLSNIVLGAFMSCHLGYRMDCAETGKGYMTEAVKHIVDYGFRELNLHRVEANIMPRNKASLRVVEKLRFREEGLATKYLRINGKWEDHVHMVILNENWTDPSKQGRRAER